MEKIKFDEEDRKTKLLIDKKIIGNISSRGQIMVNLNKDYLKMTGFKPGSDINIVYGKRKIIIVDDIRDIFNDLEGCEEIVAEVDNKKIIEASMLEINA